jgi:TetR/AcrR family transcriptional repressor of mexJK operon
MASLPTTGDLETNLRELARSQLTAVIQPDLIQFRRLVIGEADRFPDLARTYYERAPGRVLAALAALFADLSDRGMLNVDDAELAADHFAWLVLGIPLDRAMFHGPPAALTDDEIHRYADEAVRVFLAAYARPRTRRR